MIFDELLCLICFHSAVYFWNSHHIDGPSFMSLCNNAQEKPYVILISTLSQRREMESPLIIKQEETEDLPASKIKISTSFKLPKFL